MKELNISDEMLARFLEGRTDADENARLLQAMEAEGVTAEDLVAIVEAAKQADAKPLETPNLAKAEEQIQSVLNDGDQTAQTVFMDRRRSRMRVVWTIAASAAIVLAVALFVLFRPERSDQNFAQQENRRVETEVKTENQGSETTDKTELTNNDRKNKMSSNTNTKGAHSEQNDAQPALINPQKFEKNYTETKIANTLTVTKPSKNDYRVLCKNLEKSLQFEWTATNVQKLHFKVTNAQGKVLAELTDKTVTHYTLSYSKIYPERQLEWKLEVVYEDGASEAQSGHVNIDYNINDQ